MSVRFSLFGAAVAGAVLVAYSCGDEPTGPDPADLVIEIRSGDGQVGLVGSQLAMPLRVIVKHRGSGDSVPRIALDWAVVQGQGATLAFPRTTTDSTGKASNRLTLGPEPGEYRVRVSLPGLRGAAPEFTATGARIPVITSAPTAAVHTGETIVIGGRDFLPDPAKNAVLFGGMRGRVVSASTTELRVIVPACVPSRTVDLVVQVGSLRSQAVPVAVIGGTGTLELAPGAALISSDPAVLECVRLPPRPGSEYLIVPQAASTLGGARYPYRLAALLGAATAGAATAAAPARAAEQRPEREPPLAVHDHFELELRRRERELSYAAPAVSRVARAPVVQPRVGDRRTFNVINKKNEFEKVDAVVKFVSTQAVLYEDVNAPAGGLTEADYRAFGEVFDDPIHPTVVAAFGEPSDLDGNGRIIILFTTVVNLMTERGSEGFIAGFFFGNDLLDRAGSNRGEVFYTLVPDPEGKFGDARTKDRILRTVPAVLAHELQHMINFNQRVLVRGASSTESLWLGEGLAHMAEDLVGDVFARRGDRERARQFQAPNYVRATRFLEQPARTSLVASSPPGTLGERGAGWLYVKYLAEHFGGLGILRRLTQTTRTGVDNVRAETGRAWESLFADWSAALYLDDLGLAVEPRFSFPTFGLRAALGQVDGFPLRPYTAGFEDFVRADTLAASGADFVIVRAGSFPLGRLHIAVGEGTGGPFPSEARAQVTVIRLR